MFDEHKIIHLHTLNEELFNMFIDHLSDEGFEQTEEFYSMAFGYHHWHYRPGGSLARQSFKDLLISRGFEHLK